MAYYKDIIVEKSGKTKCILCKILIEDSDIDIEDHLQQKNHIQLFMQRLMIKNNVTLINNKVNCLICGTKLEYSDILDHIHSEAHNRNVTQIKTFVDKDGSFLQIPENITNRGSDLHCLICDRCIDFTLKSVKGHLNSPRHRRARCMAVQPLNGIFSVEGNNDDLYCKICQVYIENYMEIIFQHVDESPKHHKRLAKILKLIDGQNISIEKFLYDPKEDKAFCKKCGPVPCNVDNLQSHIKGKKHTGQ